MLLARKTEYEKGRTMMKKFKTLLVTLLVLVLISTLLTGCGGGEKTTNNVSAANSQSETSANVASNQSLATGNTIADSYTAYIDAKAAMISKLTEGLTANPETLFASMALLGITMIDLVMLPASFLGMGQEEVVAGLSFMNAKDIQYSESGNGYKISYSDAENKVTVFTANYDATAEAMTSSVTIGDNESLSADYRKTSYGYVGQYYMKNDDGTINVYKLTLRGEDGIIGVSSTAIYTPLTGSESFDFPKTCEEWYAVTGNTITGVMANGTAVNIVIPDAN